MHVDILNRQVEAGCIIAYADESAILSIGVIERIDDDVAYGLDFFEDDKGNVRSSSFSLDLTENKCTVLPKKYFDVDHPLGVAVLRHREKVLAS